MKINLKDLRSLFSIKLIAVAAICLVLATSYTYSAMKKDITIEDIDGVKVISTFKNTVGDVLEENNIGIKPKDKINTNMTEKLKDGMSIKISRAKEITIHSDGKDVVLLTTAPDVKSVLGEAQIKLGEKDKVSPGPDTLIKGNTIVDVVRVEESSKQKRQT